MNGDITIHYPTITRFEVIDHRSSTPAEQRGLVQSVLGADVSVAIQDDGQTMKVILADRTDGKTESSVAADWHTRLSQELEQYEREHDPIIYTDADRSYDINAIEQDLGRGSA